MQICVFVFAYANCLFSDAAAHFLDLGASELFSILNFIFEDILKYSFHEMLNSAHS